MFLMDGLYTNNYNLEFTYKEIADVATMSFWDNTDQFDNIIFYLPTNEALYHNKEQA